MRYDRVIDRRRRMPGPAAAAGLLAPAFAGLRHEELVVLYLDAGFGVLHMSIVGGGGESVAVPVARIAREALAFEARAVLIAHNHPGGGAEPSQADRRTTRCLAEALRPLSIVLVDHIVFGGRRWVSFHRRGWL